MDAELEETVTKCWASLFIDTSSKEQLLYEDMVKIYHRMYRMDYPEEPVENIADYFAAEFKSKIQLPDCTIRNIEYQMKILVYLSLQPSCPTQHETIGKITGQDETVQGFVVELVKEIDGLISSYRSNREVADIQSCEDPSTQVESWEDQRRYSTPSSCVARKLEESFSNGISTPEASAAGECWKNKYNALHQQHMLDEAEIQELTERLEINYKDMAIMKEELSDMQVQLTNQNAMSIQLEDFKTENSNLVTQLEKSNLNISKLKTKLKAISELEEELKQHSVENNKLKEELAMSQKLNEQNHQAKQELRKEFHEKNRLKVENETLQKLNSDLRVELQNLKQNQKLASSADKTIDDADGSFLLQPSLADEMKSADDEIPNEKYTKLLEENKELALKIENYEIDEQVMQDRLKSQIEEITKMRIQVEEAEEAHNRKAEQLESWKSMYQKLKHQSETKYDDIVHEHRQEMSRVKGQLNEALFLAKKEILDKESTVKRLERRLESQSMAKTKQSLYSSPTPSTPVQIRKYPKARTPSAIPRLLQKKNYSKDFDDDRVNEISKRNQTVPPHLRSTYALEAQYSNKELLLDHTGKLTTPTTSLNHAATAIPKATAFEIAQSPKGRRKRDPPAPPKENDSTEKENVGKLLQFSPPKPYYKRRK